MAYERYIMLKNSAEALLSVSAFTRITLLTVAFLLSSLTASALIQDTKSYENGDSVDSLSIINQARFLLDNHDYDSAAVILRGNLATDSLDAEAWYLLGFAMDKKENLPSAMEYYRRSIALDPLFSRPCRDLAFLFDVFAQHDSMNLYLRRATDLDLHPESLYFDFAYSFDMLGQLDSALAYYHSAIEFDSLDNEAFLNIGAIWGQMENLDSARTYTLRSLQLDSSFAQTCYNYAALLALENHPQEAIDYYQKSLALDPTLVAAKLRLGDLYETLGDSSLARIYFQEFVETAPMIYLDDIEKTKIRLKAYR